MTRQRFRPVGLCSELFFDVISAAYERTSVIVTTNLPFEQWTEVLGSQRLTGAVLDRLWSFSWLCLKHDTRISADRMGQLIDSVTPWAEAVAAWTSRVRVSLVLIRYNG